MDRRISLDEMLHALAEAKILTKTLPVFHGEEARIPITPDLERLLYIANDRDRSISVDLASQHIVLFADYRPYWGEGEPAMKLYWFFKGVE